MSFSYDPALDTDLDLVRFAISDTVSATALFPDETISALLVSEGSVNGAALRLAESLVARFAGDGTKKVGSLSISRKRSEYYASLVSHLGQTASLGAGPYCGGISVSDKAVRQANTDRVVPIFTRDQFAHPEVESET